MITGKEKAQRATGLSQNQFLSRSRAVAEADGNTKTDTITGNVYLSNRRLLKPIFPIKSLVVQMPTKETGKAWWYKCLLSRPVPVQMPTMVSVLVSPYLTFCKNKARLLKKKRALLLQLKKLRIRLRAELAAHACFLISLFRNRNKFSMAIAGGAF